MVEKPPTAPVVTTVAAEDRRAEQIKEWDTFVATAPIDFDLVRAYNVGDPVPASNVERHGYLEAGLVARVGTIAAEQAQASRL